MPGAPMLSLQAVSDMLMPCLYVLCSAPGMLVPPPPQEVRRRKRAHDRWGAQGAEGSMAVARVAAPMAREWKQMAMARPCWFTAWEWPVQQLWQGVWQRPSRPAAPCVCAVRRSSSAAVGKWAARGTPMRGCSRSAGGRGGGVVARAWQCASNVLPLPPPAC